MTAPATGPVTAESRAPQISVVIATRDRPEALARTLEALRTASKVPAEILVVDQSSDERSARVVAAGAAGTVPVVYVRDARRGLGIAQNIAFARAKCSVVAVTDDDCVPADDWLATIDGCFDADETLSAVTGRVLPLEAGEPGLLPVASRTTDAPRVFRGKAVPWEVGSGNNFAVRTEWLARVGGNDERLGPGAPGKGAVDMDLFYRLLRARATIRYEPRSVVLHAQAPRAERLARRAPYGHGIGACVAIWLAQRDPYAVVVLRAWIALRVRRLARGAAARDWTRVLEEVLVLGGTARGLLFGFFAARRSK